MIGMRIDKSTLGATWLVPGAASGAVVALAEPLSFWGGFDPHTGAITDLRHPQAGVVLTGSVVVMSTGRGSSSASSVIAEAIRLDTAPAAFVLASDDEIIALGAIVADEMYAKVMPIVVADETLFANAQLASSIALDGP